MSRKDIEVWKDTLATKEADLKELEDIIAAHEIVLSKACDNTDDDQTTEELGGQCLSILQIMNEKDKHFRQSLVLIREIGGIKRMLNALQPQS